MDAVDVEYLTDELKRLIGRGAVIHRLPLFPTLRQVLLATDELPGLIQTGSMMRTALKARIEALDEPWEFQGVVVPPDRLRRAYKLLFALEGSSWTAPTRRWRAIEVLGLSHHCALETWRRDAGPEREFVYLLARHIGGSPAVLVPA